MRRLADKIAIVTGATSGIGRGCALAMAEAGARLIVTGRNVERGRITVDMIEALGGEAVFVQQDVTRQGDWEAVIDTTLESYGRLDVLLNNAGDAILGPLIEVTLDTLQFLLRVDLEGPFLGMQAAWPHLLTAGGGSIINMSSVASSVIAAPNRFAYGTTKAAVIGMTKSIAADFITQGIRCNAICPGTVESPSLEERLAATGDYDAARAAFIARQPIGRIGKAEEIAALVTYLASDESAYTTGVAHIIDGGWANT